MRKCGILFRSETGDSFKDEKGCEKPEAHNDFHVFLNTDGIKIAWEDDYNCGQECDCWEKGEACIIYWEYKNEKTM